MGHQAFGYCCCLFEFQKQRRERDEDTGRRERIRNLRSLRKGEAR